MSRPVPHAALQALLPLIIFMTATEKSLKRRGFTLIEVMLVVIIVGLAAAVAVPQFSRSMRGVKLRSAVRTVTRAHKYARSDAILKQQYNALLFDMVKGEVALVSLGSAAAGGGFLENMSSDVEDREVQAELVLERTLPEGVSISAFETERPDQVYDQIYFVNYYPNGMCDPFSLHLKDDRNKMTVIEIDSISGSVEIREQ